MTSSFAHEPFGVPYTQHNFVNLSKFDTFSNRGKNFSKFYKTISNQIDALYKSIAPSLKLYRYTSGQTTSQPDDPAVTDYTVTINDILNGFFVAIDSGNIDTIKLDTTINSADILALLANNCYNVGTPTLRLFIYNNSGATVELENGLADTVLIQNTQGVIVWVHLNEDKARFVII
jgi:hypothetical protein